MVSRMGFMTFVCVLALAVTTMAQETKEAKKAEKKAQAAQQAPEKKAQRQQQPKAPPAAVKGVTDLLAKVDLTEEQSAKIKELAAKTSEQIAAINKERQSIIGPDIQKKMNQTRQELQNAGKKGKELQDAVYTAAGLNAEQIAKLRDLQAKQQQVIQDFRKAVSDLLTPEQRQKAGLNVQGKAKKKAQ